MAKRLVLAALCGIAMLAIASASCPYTGGDLVFTHSPLKVVYNADYWFGGWLLVNGKWVKVMSQGEVKAKWMKFLESIQNE